MTTQTPKRLAHDHRAYLRAMQISSVAVVVFVEGPLDRAFMSLVIAKNDALKGRPYAVRASKELGTGAQGKSALLEFYQYLKRSGKLLSDLDGKRTTALFILDKDALGLGRRRLRCNHAETTSHYSVENYIFRGGDLVSATVAASGLDHATVATIVDGRWLARAAQSWTDWCSFCIFCNHFNVRVSGTFGIASEMHDEQGKLDVLKKSSLIARASNKYLNSRIPLFADAYSLAERVVARHFRSSTWDRIFPGKWYGLLLADEVRRVGAPRGLLPGNLAEKITSCLIPTVDFRSSELSHLVQAAERVGQLLA